MNEPTAMTPEILESFLHHIRREVLDGLIGSGLEGEVNDLLWACLTCLEDLAENTL